MSAMMLDVTHLSAQVGGWEPAPELIIDRSPARCVAQPVEDDTGVRPLAKGEERLPPEIGTGIAVDGDMIDVRERNSGRLQAIFDGEFGEPRPMLRAPKPFLFRRRQQRTIAQDASRRVGVVSVKTKDIQEADLPNTATLTSHEHVLDSALSSVGRSREATENSLGIGPMAGALAPASNASRPMNILWLPHAPLRTGRTRSDHLIERLASRHRITVVSFRAHARANAWRYFSDLFSHRSRYGATHSELAVLRFPRTTLLNGWLLNRAVRRELGRVRHDILVVAPAPYLTGYLDIDALRGRIPIVCDYLDGGDWTETPEVTEFERRYVAAADAVMCVSKGLLRQASSLNPRSFYVPNGVELDRYRRFRASHSSRECKARLGIDPDAFVVSIIGMTCSPRLYFVDAILELASKGRNVVLLLVGESPLLKEIKARAGGASHAVRIVGAIPYAEILPYFMATDLGLSAVDEHPYYHFQSPLKIFEYGALGKPVLASPRVEEVVEMALSHVQFCEADADSLARHIDRAMTAATPLPEPDLDRYDWDRIALTVEEILMDTVRRYSAQTPRSAGTAIGRMP